MDSWGHRRSCRVDLISDNSLTGVSAASPLCGRSYTTSRVKIGSEGCLIPVLMTLITLPSPARVGVDMSSRELDNWIRCAGALVSLPANLLVGLYDLPCCSIVVSSNIERVAQKFGIPRESVRFVALKSKPIAA